MNKNPLADLANRNAELTQELAKTKAELANLLTTGNPPALVEKLQKHEETIRLLAQTSAENEIRLRDAKLEIQLLSGQLESLKMQIPEAS